VRVAQIGVVVEERITKMAGGTTEGSMTKNELIDLIRTAGKTPVERDTLYGTVRIWE
jgi:aminodeoxyfutalosine synthase